MKHLESNLVGVNVAILPVGKQYILHMKFLEGLDKDTEKKSQTCEEGGANLIISF